jgi:aryl-phospho-beta-D-glucosidase BglC (GH1 family)
MKLPLALLSLGLLACGGSSVATQPDAGPVDAAASPDAPPPVDAPVSSVGRLKVAGTQILDPSGAPIVLRGYNWGQWGTAQPQDAADNVAQGANSVRLPLRWWGHWKPGVDSRDDASPGHIDPAHLAYLDQTVQWATSHHLWTVIFVDSNYGQGANGGTDNFWTDAAAKARFVEVWQFLVARYRDTPYLAAYEILPEPMAVGVSDAEVKAFYDSIIPSIRALDARTPIVIGPNLDYNLNHLAAAYTTIDDNLIYTGDYFIFANQLAHIPDIKGFLATFHAPVWINQVGIQTGDASADTKAQDVLGALNAINVGWSWWTYRELTTSPDQHGIYYADGSGGWILKPAWLALVGSFLP